VVLNAQLLIEEVGTGKGAVYAEWQPARLGCTVLSREGTAGSGVQHSGWWNQFVSIVPLEISDTVICKGIPSF